MSDLIGSAATVSFYDPRLQWIVFSSSGRMWLVERQYFYEVLQLETTLAYPAIAIMLKSAQTTYHGYYRRFHT